MKKINQSLYIRKAILDGYRSIRHLEVDFGSGLNVIIGNNGSGKTSVIRSLAPFVSGVFDQEFLFSNSAVILKSQNEHQLSVSDFASDISMAGEPDYHYGNFKNQSHLSSSESQIAEATMKWFDKITEIEGEEGTYVKAVFIKHGLPTDLGLWNKPFNSSIKLKDLGLVSRTEIGRLLAFGMRNHQGNNFVNAFRNKIALYVVEKGDKNSIDWFTEKVKREIQSIEEIMSSFLSKCSFVKQIRLSMNSEISYNQQSNELIFRNVYFEFYSEGSWKAFDQLSDGSKRIVFLLSEIINFKDVEYDYNDSGIIFIEEPELGIHPDQLYKLMLVLKEEARNKQIIITTHSPLVLDVLERDELDNIIVCSYDNEKGTQLRHLTDKQKEKALRYMDEVNYLSLYWLHSDLEKAPE